MAPRIITAQANIELRATAASMQKMVKDLTEQLSKVDAGSALGKGLAKELPEIKKYADLYQSIISQGTISKQDLSELNKIKVNYDRKVKAQTNGLAFGEFSAFKFSNEDLKQLQQVTQQIDKLKQAKQQITANTGKTILSSALGSLNDADLQSAENLLNRIESAQNIKGFSRNKSVADNNAVLNATADATKTQLNDVKKQLKSFGAIDASGYTVKDLQALDSRKAKITGGKEYRTYAQQEVDAQNRYNVAVQQEQDLRKQLTVTGRKSDDLVLRERSEEYKTYQADIQTQIGKLEAQIAANEARMTSGDLAPKDYLTFSKKQFADNFGAIGGLSETKTVGTLAGKITNAITKMANDKGELSQNQQQAVTSWLKSTKGGLELDASSLAKTLSGVLDADAIKTELIKQMGGSGSKRIGSELYAKFQTQQNKMSEYGTNPNRQETKLLAGEANRQAEVARLNTENDSARAQIDTLEQQKTELHSEIEALRQQRDNLSNQITQAQAEQTSAKQAKKEAQQKQQDLISNDQTYQQLEVTAQQNAEKYEQLSKQAIDLEAFNNTITQLQAGFTSLIDTLNRVNFADTDDQLNAATEERARIVSNLTNRARQPGRDLGLQQDRDHNAHLEGAAKMDAVFSEQTQTQQEAESFKRQMQMSMRQWLGAREIVGYIRRGIQEAYQDIQNLDKAMTNIAVVTDFSVSDLWGQINDYMAIAKQYGVTTQGVYEVTQLYYQQGLGTSDVMAATTETLKLARISGMSYSDAADGMTVA